MKYLLRKNNLEALKAFCSSGGILFAFDFDGTLTRIVKNPKDVRMAKKTISQILKLKRKFLVAVISGRRLSDLKKVLPFKPDYAIGNHGIEGIKTFKVKTDEAKRLCNNWEGILKVALSKDQGIIVENKGLSVSVHYRLSKDRLSSKKKVLKICTTLGNEHRLIMGKMVVDIIPVFAPNKGDAVIELIKMTGHNKVFYIGDDETDEAVFNLPGKYKIFKVRVGISLKSHADFFITRQGELHKVLSNIVSGGVRAK